MAGRVFFITGKGGTGKTSLVNKLVRTWTEQEKKVLVLRIKSFSLKVGQPEAMREVSPLLSEQNLHLHRVVQEYFSIALAKIPLPSLLQKIASRVNEEVASKLLTNKYVLKFIEACPGLTPTIFLGKVCHEAKFENWDVVIVDAPSTGQALQIFESSRSLSKVLSHGMMYRHITETLEFANSENFEIQLVALPEEGPIQELSETMARLRKINLQPKKIWINKVSPPSEKKKLAALVKTNQKVSKFVKVELDRIEDQEKRMKELIRDLGVIPYEIIPESVPKIESSPSGEGAA